MKNIFKKGGVIDKATRNLDKATAEALGMENGAKPSHILNSDSSKHKEAVKFFKGQETTIQSATNSGGSEVEKSDVTTTSLPVVQSPVLETSNSSISKTSNDAAAVTETKEEQLKADRKIEGSPLSEITSTTHDHATETTNTPSSAMAKKDVEKTPKAAESITSNDNESRVSVWAKTLLDHKELRETDKQGLPYFIKTAEEVTSLTNKIFELASAEQDSSYITVAMDLVAEINQFYSGGGLLG